MKKCRFLSFILSVCILSALMPTSVLALSEAGNALPDITESLTEGQLIEEESTGAISQPQDKVSAGSDAGEATVEGGVHDEGVSDESETQPAAEDSEEAAAGESETEEAPSPLIAGDFDELKAAIATAQNNETIFIAGDIVLEDALFINTDKHLILQGQNGQVTLTAADNKRHFFIYGSAVVTLQFTDVVLDGNNAGGGIRSSATLTLINPVILNCVDNAHFGGGVYCSNGRVIIQGGEISNCRAKMGGGIYSDGVQLTGTTMTSNSSQGHGGAIYSRFGATEITNATIINNEAQSNGGGLQIENSTTVITDSQVDNNTSSFGGGIAIGEWPITGAYSITINGGTISGNSANGSHNGLPTGIGGGIIVNSTELPLSMTAVDVSGNHASLSGGGIYIKSLNKLETTNVIFSNNSASISFDWLLDENHTNELFRQSSSIHIQNIKSSTYTTPFSQAYNNYDVNFLPKYTVTFDSQGGSAVNSLQGLNHGSLIAAPAPPTYNEYRFAGWFKDPACTKAEKWDFDTDTVVEDLILYAKWDGGGSDNGQNGEEPGKETGGGKTQDLPGGPAEPGDNNNSSGGSSEILEEEVPLDALSFTGENIDILDEAAPLDNVPRTGDSTNLALPTLTLLMSMSSLLYLLLSRQKSSWIRPKK